MPVLSLDAPAKINWFLNVRSPREDGFHELCTIYQELALNDTVSLTWEAGSLPTTHPNLTLTCNRMELAALGEANLVVRAVRLFQQVTALPLPNITLHIEKRIPDQAGLGGGSSDAASILLILQHLSRALGGIEPPSEEILMQMGAQLGSDVPFFLQLSPVAIGTGRGEVITPLESCFTEKPVLLVKPHHFQSETKAAYQALKTRNAYQVRSPQPLIAALKEDSENLPLLLQNDFEASLLQFSEMQRVREGLQQLGCERPLLCGSGSCWVALGHYTAEDIATVFPEQDYWTCQTTTVGA